MSCSRDIEIEQAQRDANACARNERGVYCSSALALFSLGGIRHDDIVGNCSQTEVVITSNSCPLACQTLLEDFRRQLGCCINVYINGSFSYDNVVDYRLWNLCDVPLPAENCDNSPTINRPVDVQACTYEEFLNKQFSQNICLPQQGKPYINAIVSTSRCNRSTYLYYLAKLFVDICSVDTNKHPCGAKSGNLKNIIDASIIDDINSNCATSYQSNATCTLNCSNSIGNAKNVYGCCLNTVWLNSSISSESLLIPGLSYNVRKLGWCLIC